MKPIDYYDNGVNTCERSSLHDRELKSLNMIKNFVIIYYKGNFNLLDIGCGDGYFLNCLSTEMKGIVALYGIDYLEFQLERARKKLSQAFFKQVDLEEGIPFEDNTFDIVYAGELIEHLFNPDAFVREVFRIMKNDGVFVFSTPNINNWLSRLVFPFVVYPISYETSTEDSRYGYGFLKTIKKQKLPVGNIQVMNVDAVKSLLTANNFQIERI